MDNRNVFVAIALSMSVLLFWGAFFETLVGSIFSVGLYSAFGSIGYIILYMLRYIFPLQYIFIVLPFIYNIQIYQIYD